MADHSPLRIQKFLADSGVCSRRAAERLIEAGQVFVNGRPAQLGEKVVPGKDRVTASGRAVRGMRQQRITLAVNKPRGLVCTHSDPFHQRTIFSVLPRELSHYRFICAGRLDKESEGLVILTTDGDLAHRLMHPSNSVVKRYFVELDRPYPAARLRDLEKGVVVDGERLSVEHADLIGHGGRDPQSARLDVHLHHGRKREIRQLFSTLGYTVKRLRRYQIGAFQIRGIPLHAMKQLSTKEISLLFQERHPKASPDRHSDAPPFANET